MQTAHFIQQAIDHHLIDPSVQLMIQRLTIRDSQANFQHTIGWRMLLALRTKGLACLDPVMGYGGTFGSRWLGGANIHPSIDLAAVSVDDFGLVRQMLTDGYSQRCLADASCADDGNYGILGRV